MSTILSIRQFAVSLIICVVSVISGMSRSACAMNLYSYDLDSLTFLSTDIVEGKLSGGRLVISAVNAGQLTVGQTIGLNRMDYYFKANGNPFGGQPVESGDRLFLFLKLGPKPDVPDFSIPAYVFRGHVYTFEQWSNPGPYMAGPMSHQTAAGAPTVVEFRQSIRDSLKKTAPWKAQFAAPSSARDISWLLSLLKQRAISQPWMYYNRIDGISVEIEQRLLAIHDFSAIEQAIVIDPSSNLMMGRAFETPEGLDYLFRRLSDKSVPRQNRVALTYGLWMNSGPSTRPQSDPQFGKSRFFERLAQLAIINSGDTEVDANIVDWIGRCAGSARAFRRWGARQNLDVDAQALRDVFNAPGTSEELKYRIELAMINFGKDEFRKLGSRCGPMPSLASPADLKTYGAPNASSVVLSYSFTHPEWNDPVTGAVLVLESVQTGKQTTVQGSIKPPGSQTTLSGIDCAPLPVGLPPGKYRLFYRLMNGTQAVGEGHYFETTLPQALTVVPPMAAFWTPAPASWFPSFVRIGVEIAVVFVPVVLFLASIVRGKRNRRRFRQGLCIQCGFDLRASKDRCPECEAPLPQHLDSSWWKRPLFKAMSVATAVIPVAVLVFWIRGYHVSDCLSLNARWLSGSVYSTRGDIVVENGGALGESGVTYEKAAPTDLPRSADEAGGVTGFRFAGFELSPDVNLIVIPCWLIAVASLLGLWALTASGRGMPRRTKALKVVS